MKNLSLLPIVLAFLTSCSVSYVPIPREYLLDETVEILQENATKEIVKAHEAEMGEKYGMTLYEPTDIKMYDKVSEIRVSYVCDKKVSLEEARKIHIDVHESLLEAFNSHPKYNRYMKEYPFTEENVRVAVGYHPNKENYKELYDRPFINVTSNMAKGPMLRFFMKGDKAPHRYSHEETY